MAANTRFSVEAFGYTFFITDNTYETAWYSGGTASSSTAAAARFAVRHSKSSPAAEPSMDHPSPPTSILQAASLLAGNKAQGGGGMWRAWDEMTVVYRGSSMERGGCCCMDAGAQVHLVPGRRNFT